MVHRKKIYLLKILHGSQPKFIKCCHLCWIALQEHSSLIQICYFLDSLYNVVADEPIFLSRLI